MGKRNYYILTTLFIILGFSFAIILTYNHFYTDNSISLFCSEGGKGDFFDCAKVSQGKYSSLFGIPFSIYGMAFYISVIFYYTLPSLNEKRENFLKIPFFIMLILANLIDILMLSFSIIVIKAFCTQCSMIYIANLGILIVFYLFEMKDKDIADEITSFFGKLKKNLLYQKELTIFLSISILFFALLYLFSKNKKIHLNLEKDTKQTELVNHKADKKIDSKIDKKIKEIYQRRETFKHNFKLPYTGNKNAPIDITVFHDLQCPHCQDSFFTMEEELKEYMPFIKISYLNLPFGRSGRRSQLNSFQLALYSWFAFEKGKYNEFLSSLFKKFEKRTYIDKEEISKIFKEIGINENLSKIEEKSLAYNKEITEQANKAREFFREIKAQSIGTPAVFINGRFIGIGHNEELINKVVRKEIIDFAKTKINK